MVSPVARVSATPLPTHSCKVDQIPGDLVERHYYSDSQEFAWQRDVYSFLSVRCWTDFYTLGVLEANLDANPLDAKSWTKINHPFLSTDPSSGAFGPGHNGFFKSPNGQEDWIIYHANPEAEDGCNNFRSPRIQRFTWNPNCTPNFGRPAPVGQPLEKPRR
jgi:GH43 family beta-xylosidase